MTKLLDAFVLVRIVRMNDVDINLFKFDYDLTWAGVFLGPDERVYGRYGGRDAGDAEARLSIAGVKHTLRAVLAYHGQQRPSATSASPRAVARAADLLSARGGGPGRGGRGGRGCMHCHQVWEGERRQARASGSFDPESVYVYPLPENVGLRLDLTAGNRVVGVLPDSPAARAGLRAEDQIDTIGVSPIFSQGDVMWALHNAPPEGTVTLRYQRQSKRRIAALKLARGWKKSDLSWRPSFRRERRFRPERRADRPGVRDREVTTP